MLSIRVAPVEFTGLGSSNRSKRYAMRPAPLWAAVPALGAQRQAPGTFSQAKLAARVLTTLSRRKMPPITAIVAGDE